MENFKDMRICNYKGEIYHVRDNGAVYRQAKKMDKPRKDDNKWTFGQMDTQSGYLKIGSHRVHIIVATAFLGAQDSKRYIVDHYDLNRKNNRIDNLRWLTKIEYALFNEASLKKIIWHYKSLKNFMEAPNSPSEIDKELYWLQSISQKEATSAGQRLLEWLKNPYEDNYRKSKILLAFKDDKYYSNLICINKAAYPPTATQVYWNTPTEFPLCPTHINHPNPLELYYQQLTVNEVITRNIYSEYIIDEFALLPSNKLIIRSHTSDNIKKYSIIEVRFDGTFFIHLAHTFFEENGALKKFTILQGKEWLGKDSIDDYC